MSKNPKDSIGPLVIGVLCFIPLLWVWGFAYSLIQIIFGIIMIPVILFIWSLIGSIIGFGLIALINPSYADELELGSAIDFPKCLKSKGYWISLCVTVVYLLIATQICKPSNGPVPEDDRIFYLLKCAFFCALPFLGMSRARKGDG